MPNDYHIFFSSETNEWATPQSLFDDLDSEFHFTLDPCCTHENAKCRRHFTIEEDGLKQSWGGNQYSVIHLMVKVFINGSRKPGNINIIFSSLFLNNNGQGIMKKYSFIDKVFTVYTLEYLLEHPEIKINCGSRDCFSCSRCYKKGGDPVVNELLKSDQKKAVKAGIKLS